MSKNKRYYRTLISNNIQEAYKELKNIVIRFGIKSNEKGFRDYPLQDCLWNRNHQIVGFRFHNHKIYVVINWKEYKYSGTYEIPLKDSPETITIESKAELKDRKLIIYHNDIVMYPSEIYQAIREINL